MKSAYGKRFLGYWLTSLLIVFTWSSYGVWYGGGSGGKNKEMAHNGQHHFRTPFQAHLPT